MGLFGREGSADGKPQERPIKRKPFANLVKKLGFNRSGDNQQEKTGNGNKKSNGGLGGTLKHKKHNTWSKNNNPYPESGHVRPVQQASQPSFGESARRRFSTSYSSLPISAGHDREEPSHSNKSGAPTLATNTETVHSDAGHSRAATATTGAGALSSMDCTGAGSTFSSPTHSDHSLATTLTTIQSQSNAGAPNGASGVQHNHTQPIGSQFSHQYPVSPAASAMTASAIPRHLHGDTSVPHSYGSTAASGLLADNASIMTLASSSKRRRRSMDTDASVRAMAPSSNFGGSRESLPLSVLSANIDPPRHSIQAGSSLAAERASVYSSSGLGRDGISSPIGPSERNSYYAKQTAGDAKSLRSITNLKNATDASSITGIYPRSEYEAKRDAGDVASLRSVDAAKSIDHTRNNSIGSPVNSPSLLRQTSIGGTTALSLSERSSEWRDREQEGDEVEG
ncbi:Hypothetical predicted protein [Lecanosticta acicola]|uniref:Uncharacterized protein n=1 Tax=Lecanosticta acicola TaxID=111012 RepID=A0AAI9E825_9PEZI|nr:Hypothetical predicted protein [Lecanosticta acicola]